MFTSSLPCLPNCHEQNFDLFISLVREGGEAGDRVLAKNTRRAKLLGFGRIEGETVGVAALKHPQPSYRDDIGEKAGFRIRNQITLSKSDMYLFGLRLAARGSPIP